MKNMQEVTKKAMEFTKNIKPRQKAAFFAQCEKAEGKAQIFEIAKNFVLAQKESLKNYDNEEVKKIIYNLFACGFAWYNMKKAETWVDYMQSYATFKANTYEKLSDYGAFADLVETTAHLLVNKKIWRVRLSTLHVSKIGNIDLRLNGQKIEVGTNGKSWLESTENDPMNGNFTAVIYGVFSEDEKQAICNLFAEGQVKKAIATIANMLYYFEDKYSFADFINSISRSPSLVWKKQGYFQTVYNPSKHGAFIRKVENENVPTFADIIGKNEFTE
jgi:hypothetical protein